MTNEASKNTKKNTIRTSVTLTASDYSDLEQIAEKKKVSIAWVVREAVERYLNKEVPLFRRRQD